MAERINAGYTIIQSVTVGDTEFVLGENRKAPDPYVTWCCDGGTNYNWGRYFGSYHRARTNLFERALEMAGSRYREYAGAEFFNGLDLAPGRI